MDVFHIVQHYLTKINSYFHTLPLPEKRVLKVVIKDLPNDKSESEISDKLILKDYNVKTTHQFTNFIRKFPIYMITLAFNQQNIQIFNESKLFYISIKVEPFQSNKPAQFFACQRFGHSSNYCGYTPRCGKCSGPHLAKNCSKSRKVNPKCANCNVSQMSNFSKRPAFLE